MADAWRAISIQWSERFISRDEIGIAICSKQVVLIKHVCLLQVYIEISESDIDYPLHPLHALFGWPPPAESSYALRSHICTGQNTNT
jgi:hypothetical protein